MREVARIVLGVPRERAGRDSERARAERPNVARSRKLAVDCERRPDVGALESVRVREGRHDWEGRREREHASRDGLQIRAGGRVGVGDWCGIDRLEAECERKRSRAIVKSARQKNGALHDRHSAGSIAGK